MYSPTSLHQPAASPSTTRVTSSSKPSSRELAFQGSTPVTTSKWGIWRIWRISRAAVTQRNLWRGRISTFWREIMSLRLSRWFRLQATHTMPTLPPQWITRALKWASSRRQATASRLTPVSSCPSTAPTWTTSKCTGRCTWRMKHWCRKYSVSRSIGTRVWKAFSRSSSSTMTQKIWKGRLVKDIWVAGRSTTDAVLMRLTAGYSALTRSALRRMPARAVSTCTLRLNITGVTRQIERRLQSQLSTTKLKALKSIQTWKFKSIYHLV